MADEAARGDARQADDGRTAVRMGPGVTAGAWFVIDPDNGGHYTDGEREGVADWPKLEKPARQGQDKVQ